MSEFYDAVMQRFLRYAGVHTTSSHSRDDRQSMLRQRRLGEMLASELTDLGASDVFLGDGGIVYASIPSNLPDESHISVGFVAHMDTSPDAPGENVKPWVCRDYRGGDVVLNEEQGIVLRAADYPRLEQYIGKTLIFSDGTTLLGGDDKAAIAAIMTMAEYILTHPEFRHGPVKLAFTPDEEVGRGVESFDVARFGANVAYTVDGDALGGVGYETFNATTAKLAIHGLSVHPGTAKGIMKNAIEIGGEFMGLLPALERPQNTCGREGYFHPFAFDGKVELTELCCLIRDFELDRFNERIEYVKKCVDELNGRYGAGTVTLDFENTYYSMREVVKTVPYMVDYAKKAIESCGVEYWPAPLRGGTDGSVLSQMGLPCPNITAGYENAHGRFEYVCAESMDKNVDILLSLIRLYAEHEA